MPNESKPFPYRKSTSGTGFFVRKGAKTYLITAEHVAKNLKSDVIVVVHGPEDTPLLYNLKDLLGPGKEQTWFFHQEADVALIRLNLSSEFKGKIKVLKPDLMLASENDYYKFKNRELTTIGFPLSLGLTGKFSPIVKSSKAASDLFSYNYQRSDKKIKTTFLVLEDPSVQGFSGGPVYAMSKLDLGPIAFTGGHFVCIGLVHGTLTDNTGGKFAAIVPSYFITQLIENYENQSDQEE